LVGLDSGRLCGTSDKAQAMPLHETVQMLDANSTQVHDLCISEEFLACFDGCHTARPLNPCGYLNFKEFADDSNLASAKLADLMRFALALLTPQTASTSQTSIQAVPSSKGQSPSPEALDWWRYLVRESFRPAGYARESPGDPSPASTRESSPMMKQSVRNV